MLILAIDTALEACAVAVLDTDANALRVHESQAMARGHAEALMPMIDRVMRAGGLSFAVLDRIAVTIGPGSFTGLRVGISPTRLIMAECPRARVLPSGRPDMALTWFSNWLVSAPSMVQ